MKVFNILITIILFFYHRFLKTTSIRKNTDERNNTDINDHLSTQKSEKSNNNKKTPNIFIGHKNMTENDLIQRILRDTARKAHYRGVTTHYTLELSIDWSFITTCLLTVYFIKRLLPSFIKPDF